MFHLITKRIPLQRTIITPVRFSSKNAKSKSPPPPKATAIPNVPGLTESCVNVPNTPVGPGASKTKDYKNPEYFCYHVNSFAEAEVEMAKFRLPAPSNKMPFNR